MLASRRVVVIIRNHCNRFLFTITGKGTRVRILLHLVVIYVVFCVVLFFIQKRLIFFPGRQLVTSPGELGKQYREVWFPSSDGVRINAWIVEPENVLGNVIVCHGNAGNISHRQDTFRIFEEMGCRTLIFDYRGYGLSEGKPDEEGLYVDCTAAIDFFCREYGLEPGDLVYFGRSLGSAVALEASFRRPPAALILESAFTCTADMGGVFRYMAPLSLLITQKFDNIEKIPRVTVPLLVIHSKEDDVVPFDQGRRLFEAAVCTKEFLEIRGDHNYGFVDSGEIYTRGLVSFLEKNAR